MKARTVVAGLLVACGLSGLTAASAAGYGFVVEGREIKEAEALTASIKSATTSFYGTAQGVKIQVQCAKDKGNVALEFSGSTKGGVTFESCKIYSVNSRRELTLLSKCTVANFELFFNDKLIAFKSLVADEFVPAETAFGEIEITGTGCTAFGTYPIKGKAIGVQPEAGVEKETHITEFNPAEAGSQSLELGEGPAEIVGVEEVTLAGKKWSEN
ncbi:MAG TPA: hypothetical protein VGY13_09080 [Solirubrobacteraceae bacterium]|nr:hypothetical protein [Solirubrobacteraceae bacterium]